jgi:tyrosyl-tRNA synthetase
MDVDKRFELIEKDSVEIVTKEKLLDLLGKKKKFVSYWGVAPTGPPHIGYYRTLAKQIELVKAGFHHKVLIANLHAYLDDMKAPWSELKVRGEIYKKCFQLLGLKGANVEYVIGSDIQLTKEYHLETLKASALVTTKRATRAASEVVRMADPKVSSMIYPIMQALDCWLLDVDLAYSGIDNRHVYMLASELLVKLGHKAPAYVFTPLGIGLSGGGKMSASEKDTRLELYARPDEIRVKIKKAFCPEGQIEDNPILEYCKYFVFPRVKRFEIKRPKKFGGDLVYTDYGNMEEDFKVKKVHPLDLKNAAAEALIEILKPIRDYFDKTPNLLKTFEK